MTSFIEFWYFAYLKTIEQKPDLSQINLQKFSFFLFFVLLIARVS